VYTKFFGLNEKPFSITPDPRYLYLSQRHADALAHLVYGVSESGGFIQLTGEVGTGKTTLIRSLLEQLPAKAQIALILNPQLSVLEFLQAICQELRVSPPAEGTVKAWIDGLNAYLLRAHANGQRVVLIVDEAQQLDIELLEQIRLLTNLETAKTKLLQIILIGQPELRAMLSRPELRQIAQRITGRYHLEPLSREDTVAYVHHRMKVAGSAARVFAPRALRALYRYSKGVPRLINVVADRTLLAAYAEERLTIGPGLVRRAAAEVFGQQRGVRPAWRWAAAGLAGAGLAWASVQWPWPGFVQPSGEAPATRELALTAPASPPVAAIELEPAPEVERPLPLLERLTQAEVALTANEALTELLAVWQLDYDAALGPPCEQAAQQGLRCLLQTGSLAELRRLNRPAVLSLTDPQGREFHVVLGRLAEQQAELVAGETKLEVAIGELASAWYGEYLILWRPGAFAGRELAPGMRDERVHRLREAIGRIAGVALDDPADPLLYDEVLASHVRAYQRSRRLTVDGIVGVETQLALSADLNSGEAPRLVADH
jgi:general secretion pathway protein A